MGMLKTIIIENEDGARREVSADKLSRQTLNELLASAQCTATLPEGPRNYILLQWKDGWKEVTAVDDQAAEVLRYYTIERNEVIGRISLEMPKGPAPELLIVRRHPDRIDNILFVGRNGVQMYKPEEKATVREGSKLEHIYYDKTKPNFSMEPTEAASASYVAAIDGLKVELEKKGLNGPALLAKSEAERIPVYSELARALGIRGSERQQDVYGFIQLALEKLAAPK